jgi:diaminopimelate epimerase
MEVSFYKLRVCDADLILVDDISGGGRVRDWSLAARKILDRRKGAGADRLAVLAKAEESVWLKVFRPDGEASLCVYDAALAAARFLLDSGRSGSESVHLRTSEGELAVDVLDSANLGLTLGPPRSLESGRILDLEGLSALRTLIETEGARYEALPLGLAPRLSKDEPLTAKPRLGAVAVICDGGAVAARAQIRAAARGREAPPPLPLRVVSRGELWVQAQRGEELDSASASALALAAAAALGYADREATVRLKGGALYAEWSDRGELYVAARPEYVYRGEFHLDEEA